MEDYSKFELVYDILDKANFILCSQNKSYGYVRKDRSIAYSYPFIQLNSEYFIRTLSVDIDRLMTIQEIKKIALTNKLPNPTFIVNTDKGHHVHWVLEKVVNNRNKAALSYAQDVQKALTWVYKADHCAIGVNRVWRNPLQHKSEYTELPINLKDFKYLLKKFNKQNKATRRKPTVSIDFSTVEKGERHYSMFNHLRNHAYRNSDKDLETVLYAEAELQNSLMTSPMSPRAINTMISSIISWMEEKFTTNPKTHHTAQFNRDLAMKKQDVAFNKVFDIVKNMSKEEAGKLSMKKLAKEAGVSWATAKKHVNAAIEAI